MTMNLIGTFDWTLVAISYTVSVFGAFIGLLLAGMMTDQRSSMNRSLLVGSAIAFGGGAIWSMHFIGMLAYQVPLIISYDATLTAGSMLAAIVMTGLAVSIVGSQPKLKFGRLIIAGTLMGLGVACMHYLGMLAMHMEAEMHHNPLMVAASVVVAIIVSIVGLWIAFTVRRAWQRFASAFIIGAAVCGMHYSAMFGVSFTAPVKQILKQIPNIWVTNFDVIVYTSGTVVMIMFISLVLGGKAVLSRDPQTITVAERR
ncbi:MAG: MHYT domain-containing protein [Gammaproteobacteria bacterium]